ncbi:MAG: hypothetical protein JRN15_08835 [Nitrososphaerota archaeon]|nr:hypothetical protein [Nitrososphaerota archaeon]
MKNSLVAVAIIIAVLVGGGIGYEVGTSSTLTRTTTETTTQYTIVTSHILEQCSSAQSPGPIGLLFGAVYAGSNPAIICVQFYYYSDNPLTLDLSNFISIDKSEPVVSNGSTQYQGISSGMENFTVTTCLSELVLGGSNDTNEGTVVAFAVSAKQNASGTYGISVQPSGVISTYMIAPSEPVECGEYGMLVAGSGQPNYFPEGGCLTYTVSYASRSTTNPSNYHSIPGVQYPLISGDLYFRVVGVTNSTR